MTRSFVAAHLGQDVVEAVVAFLRLSAVPIDPLRHQVEHLRLEVARPTLSVLALADEARLGEHLDVLGHRLHRHVVGIGQLPHGGISHGETRHHVAPRRISESGEDPGQLVIDHEGTLCSTEWLKTTYPDRLALSTTWLRTRRSPPPPRRGVSQPAGELGVKSWR